MHTTNQFKSRPALFVMGVIGFVLAYALTTRAIDTGSWWQYLGVLVLLIVGTRLIVRSIKPKK